MFELILGSEQRLRACCNEQTFALHVAFAREHGTTKGEYTIFVTSFGTEGPQVTRRNRARLSEAKTVGE